MSYYDWSTDQSLNGDALGGPYIAEGCPPNQLNDAVRTVMAQLRSLDLIAKTGGTFTGTVSVVGTGTVQLTAAGDVVASRAGGASGAIYFGMGATRYIYHDGTNFNFIGGPLYAGANIVWNAGNDGSGSGLDADLLDGQQASAFALLSGATFVGTITAPTVRVDANGYMQISAGNFLLAADANDFLTYIRATDVWTFNIGGVSTLSFSASAITFLGSVVWTAANDGAGSGLDADLLDGQQGAYYLPAGSYTAADVLAKLLTVDGSGSGVDADLWRGQTPAQLFNTSGTAPYFATRAWVCFAGDGTFKAGGNIASVVRNSTGDYTITFTNDMPTANYAVSISTWADNSTGFAADNLTKGIQRSAGAKQTGSVRVIIAGAGPAPFDAYEVTVSIVC